jgi:hypothetical protein
VKHGGNVVDRRLLPLLRDQPDRTDLLGDEHAAIGQKRNAPGQVERRDLGHRERQAWLRLLFARVDLRPRTDRQESDDERRFQNRLHGSPSIDNFLH